jgi:endonuclease/exonuclease/phosphatase family metal-dependent hydrolase
MPLRVLTWNLFHGRAIPARNANLCDAFARRLAGWEWDVALLQEVPPWWPPALAAAAGAHERQALTSRNAALPLRRAVARRWPELAKSSGGGCNAILVRGEIAAHAVRRLCLLPERRVVHAVRDGAGRWFANVHATAHLGPRARGDVELARATALRWAAGAPLVLGGDLNLRDPDVPGFAHAGGHDVDHVLTHGLAPAGPAETLDRGPLSDHAPVRVTLDEAAAVRTSAEGTHRTSAP